MNKCRTDSTSYHDPDDVTTSEEDLIIDAKKKQRATEFYDVFVHGDKSEALEIAETLLDDDVDLKNAVLNLIVSSIASQHPTGSVGKSADKAALNYMNHRLENNSDLWSGE